MKHKLKIGYDNFYYGVNRTEFEEGEIIEFTVPFVTDVNTTVSSEEVILKRIDTDNRGYSYCFSMPACDVTIDISHTGNMTMQGTPVMGSMSDLMAMGGMMAMNMMNGSVGGAQVSGIKRKFCRDCGAKLVREGQKFCQECGAKQEEENCNE